MIQISLILSLSVFNNVALCFHAGSTKLNSNMFGTATPLQPLPLKASISSDNMNINSEEIDTRNTNEEYNAWSDIQEWALKDNLSKYTITTSTHSFILWNTMINEVTELQGYTIPYLQSKLQDTKQIVPYITNYEFVNNGGIKGEIYNKAGIADSSVIITDALVNVVNTLPSGYVQTVSNNDNTGMVYELGYAMNDQSKLVAQRSTLLQSLSSNINDATSDATSDDTVNLVKNVAGVTALALGSGIAYNLLTHHLTVNVFWV